MKELYAIDKSTLVSIADAVRGKKGTSASIPVSNLASEIASISSGGGGGEATTYTLSGTWKQTVECYDTIVVHGNISGTVTVSGTKNSFRSITYTGLGEPYIYFYSSEYYQGSSSDATYTAHTIHPISVNFGETEQEVDKSFYNWFTKYFTKVEDSGGDDGGGDSGTTYTLSGTWKHTIGNWIDSTVISQDINGTVDYEGSYGNSGTYAFTSIECSGEGEPWMSFYNGSTQVCSTAAHTPESTYIHFGETEQTVSETFYNWFTESFTKI